MGLSVCRKMWPLWSDTSSTFSRVTWATFTVTETNCFPFACGRSLAGTCGDRGCHMATAPRGLAGGHQVAPMPTERG